MSVHMPEPTEQPQTPRAVPRRAIPRATPNNATPNATPKPVTNISTALKARGARRAPSARDPGRARAGPEVTRGHLRRAAPVRSRVSSRLGWQLRLCTWRRTAGCRPCVTPGAACHRLAAVTLANRAVGNGHPSGVPVLSRAKITVKGAPSARRTRWRCAPPRTVIFVGSLLAPVGRMARSEAGPDTSTPIGSVCR